MQGEHAPILVHLHTDTIGGMPHSLARLQLSVKITGVQTTTCVCLPHCSLHEVKGYINMCIGSVTGTVWYVVPWLPRLSRESFQCAS